MERTYSSKITIENDECEESIRMHETSTSMPHCKAAMVDFYLMHRRWIPVTEAHWYYWHEVMPPLVTRNNMVMCSEMSAGDYASVVYCRRDGYKGEPTYWFTMATEDEVLKGDIRLTLPFADYLPVFRDIGDQEKTYLHAAVIEDHRGTHHQFHAFDEDALNAQVATWCRENWEEFMIGDIPEEDASCIEVYFENQAMQPPGYVQELWTLAPIEIPAT